MSQFIEVPGIGMVEFPDDMNDEQIASAIKTNIKQLQNASMPQPSFGEKALVGLGRGFTDVGEGLKQAYLAGTEKLGMQPKGTTEQYTKGREEERQFYSQTPIGQSTTGKVGRFAGNVLPYLPMAANGILANAATGAGIGATSFVPEGESRLNNTIAGGIFGAAVPPVMRGLMSKNPYVKAGTGAALGAAGGYAASDSPFGPIGGAAAGAVLPFAPSMAINALKPLTNKILNKITGQPIANAVSRSPIDDVAAMNMMKGVDEKAALKAKAAADRLGVTITPAEASGSPLAAAKQGQLGTSDAGGEALFEFGKKRLGQEKQVISNLLNDISPDNTSAASNIRDATKRILTKKDQILQNAAKPFYEKSASDLIPSKEFKKLNKTSLFSYYLDKVKNDPLLSDDIAKFPDNSIKVLDYVKKYMDDDIGRLIREEGVKSNKAALLTKQKNSMLEMMDNYSPNYKAGRNIYTSEGANVRQLRESNLGRIADLDDIQLKNISKIIFDPAQTDSKVLIQLRNEIKAENPEAWARLIRNEMERRLDGAGDYAGSAFYSKILKNDRDFRQFLIATKGMPQVQKKLIDARRTFKNLIEPVSTKTAARLAKSSLDVPRSTYEAGANAIKNMLGGKYDQAAIKLITNNQWDKEFATISKIKDRNIQAEKLADLFGRISAATAVNAGEK
jgi:hypothetical protein